MSTDRDVTRIVRSWLRTDDHESADHILREVVNALDATPQRRATWWPAWRFAQMTSFAKLATAVTALAISVAGIVFIFGGAGAGVVATPTASPAATPSPSAAVTGPSATASAAATSRVPGEFTACLPSNTELRTGTDETSVVTNPDGDMTLARRRGYTWSGTITATDARFSGTHYYRWDGDVYTLPSGASGPEVVAEGHRIENDQGAWQGSSMMAGLSEATRTSAPVFLMGEGAYRGLKAILFSVEGSCFMNFKGVVLDFPEPPVPATTK